MIIVAIAIGLLIGILWYLFGERFDKKSMSPTCWERLHYYNKERFPLFLVHIKSILAGAVLIWLAFSKYKYKNEIIAAIGSAIIGLHIFQWYDEQQFINNPV
jgi:hypothetical protein